MNPHANIVQRDRDNATALAKAIVASAGTPIYNSCDAGALRIQIAAAILDSVNTARVEAASEIERLRTRAAAWEAEARAYRNHSAAHRDTTGHRATLYYEGDAVEEIERSRAHTDAVMKAQEKKP